MYTCSLALRSEDLVIKDASISLYCSEDQHRPLLLLILLIFLICQSPDSSFIPGQIQVRCHINSNISIQIQHLVKWICFSCRKNFHHSPHCDHLYPPWTIFITLHPESAGQCVVTQLETHFDHQLNVFLLSHSFQHVSISLAETWKMTCDRSKDRHMEEQTDTWVWRTACLPWNCRSFGLAMASVNEQQPHSMPRWRWTGKDPLSVTAARAGRPDDDDGVTRARLKARSCSRFSFV